MQETYMRRAIELAKKGIGAVNPNPLVPLQETLLELI